MNYPPNMILRPIDSWPKAFTDPRRSSPFDSTLTNTLKQLAIELRQLGTGMSATILQMALQEKDFRLTDGMPRANATPEHPGVILTIESRHGTLSYPCDAFLTWQDNLRAITLGLESLRRVERYGITQTGQQYQGWKAIESPESRIESSMTIKEVIEYLAALAEMPPTSSTEGLALIVRKAKHAVHPDRRHGDHGPWYVVLGLERRLKREGCL